MAQQFTPLSPDWWVRRLHKQLADRQEALTLLERYYCGDHPLPHLHEKARDPFRRMLKMSRSNYTQLVVDAAAGRTEVVGFRTSSPDEDEAERGDDEAWRIWQANHLDADSDLVFTEAYKLGLAYMLVEPNRANQSTPIITPEHPSQAIVECQPGSRRVRAAGLKEWLDDWTGLRMATLYLPGRIYTYSAKDQVGVIEPKWELAEEGPNPLGEVPLIEFANRPSMLHSPASEIEGIIDIQNRINKTLADRLMAQEYGAFKQKWVTGFEVPSDENGNAVEPFKVAVDRILVAEDDKTTFGEFSATDLKPYLEAMRDDITDIAAITSTPPHYLLGDMVNLSAEALKAAEAGLVAKVRNRMRHLGEATEETMRLALKAAGSTRSADTASEAVWRNPEFRTEGELVDALLKMKTLNVPEEALWERWGASPQEIRRWKKLRDEREQQAANRILGADFAAFSGPKPPRDEPEPEPVG